jgi:FG-GAP repeat
VDVATPRTGSVVFGDINSDGRPDLLMTVPNTQGGVGFFKLLQTP